ncbi:MAG TPA: DUF1292 domain-containing protein [Acholeplasmataceae bacterium]|jgi:uncharacterized protein YrzB (UPF0473 family)|nr:DUF1292 domain-containing protein [Acholeplasmataceae bacterium]
MDKEHLTFIDEDGNEILCEILFTFDSELFKKSYVLFYPVTESDEDDIEVMAASYIPGKEGDGELFPIETDEEWELIERVLRQYEEDNAGEFAYDDDEDDEDFDDECCEECEDDECCDCEDEEEDDEDEQ